jgi:hypothetical protein
MDKGIKDKLARSPGENGGKQNAQDLHSRNGGDKTKGKTQEKMERRGRKGSASARSEEMETAGEIGKNGRILFDRPKPTVGCSANGRRHINRGELLQHVSDDTCSHHQAVHTKVTFS